jgi:hypothetical protein
MRACPRHGFSLVRASSAVRRILPAQTVRFGPFTSSDGQNLSHGPRQSGQLGQRSQRPDASYPPEPYAPRSFVTIWAIWPHHSHIWPSHSHIKSWQLIGLHSLAWPSKAHWQAGFSVAIYSHISHRPLNHSHMRSYKGLFRTWAGHEWQPPNQMPGAIRLYPSRLKTGIYLRQR